MAYIGKTPTPAPLTSSDIAADIINNTHIGDTAISGFDALATAPADTDEFLISDAGVLKRIDASLVGGGGITEADQWRLTSDISGGTGQDLTANLERADNHSWGVLGTGMSQSSGIFTFPSTGHWQIFFQGLLSHQTSGMARNNGVRIYGTTNNSSYTEMGKAWFSFDGNSDGISYNSGLCTTLFKVADTSNYKVKFAYFASDSNITLISDTNYQVTAMTFIRLGDI